MKLMKEAWLRAARMMMKTGWSVMLVAIGSLAFGVGQVDGAEAVSTTTVQGTVYLANGQPGSGTLHVSWPAFTTANGQAVVADSSTVTVGQDGFVSVNLAPNEGAYPGGLFYTAVFYMSDGSVSTQYWVVPSAAQASLAQVQAQVMPAAQAVQAVNKAYVDQSIAQLSQTQLSASGGTLSGPLMLSGDPTQPLQAADKHYVDSAVSQSGTVGGGNSGQIAYYTANGTAIGGMNSVPITAGGTGATSAQGALQNLGGISTSATSQQTLAGPLNANVNGVIAVTVFGAKGDCTGSGSTASCTDNYAAIQAAIDAAYASGAAVYFPANPSASGQTVYYTSQAINPKGVSLFGPPGASGPDSWNANVPPVAVRGAPAKDTFNVPDPTTPGWVQPHTAYTVKDMAILVDDSGNASASFPHRFPGRHCFDVSANGTNFVTSNTQCEFQAGDIGQAIKVGSTVTTITAVGGLNGLGLWTTATLATTVPTGSNLAMYISVMGLPVTQTIGNCGWAYDAKDYTAPFGTAPLKARFEDVVIQTIDGQAVNATCGYFFQGPTGPTSTRWEHGYAGGQFGFAFVPADTVANTSQAAGIGDYNVWDHMWIGAPYPFLAYDGGFGHIEDMQLSGIQYGPQIIAAIGVTPRPGWWHIDVPEVEQVTACSSIYTTLRLAGENHVVTRLGEPYCSSGSGPTIQWDASQSRLERLNPISLGAINITGIENKFFLPSATQSYTISNTGFANQLLSGPQFPFSNSLGGKAAARDVCGWTRANWFGDPTLCSLRPYLERTHEFLDKGATNYYFNGEDIGFIHPDEVSFDGGGGPPTVVADSSSDTGRAVQLAGTNGYTADILNATPLTAGQQLPFGKMRFYIKVASVGSSVSGWGFQLWTPGFGLCNTGSTLNLTTTYQVFWCDVDATGLATYAYKQVYIQFNAPGAGNTVNIAWMGFRPYDTDGLFTSLRVGFNGTPMTGNHGTGASVQHSDGTGASGNLAQYNSDGSLTNGPAPPSGAIVGTTDTQTLTNKSIAGSEINSGTVAPANGGTGQNESTATGVGQWSSGVYSVSNTLANGTAATTQSAGDNSTKVATTAYVASPGAISPTSVTASGLIAGGNDTIRTTAATIGTTSFTSTGLVLPTVPANSTRVAHCVVYWQMSSTSYTATFGIGMSNTPSGLWGGASVTYAAGTSSWLSFSQTTTAATAVSTAATAGAANTTYRAEIDFTLQTGGTNPVAVTLYGEVSSASATLTIEPGSACYWLP